MIYDTIHDMVYDI